MRYRIRHKHEIDDVDMGRKSEKFQNDIKRTYGQPITTRVVTEPKSDESIGGIIIHHDKMVGFERWSGENRSWCLDTKDLHCFCIEVEILDEDLFTL